MIAINKDHRNSLDGSVQSHPFINGCNYAGGLHNSIKSNKKFYNLLNQESKDKDYEDNNNF